MIVLPEDARPDDPRWKLAFLELAHGLVMAGAKSSIIARFTHLAPRKIGEIYQALRGTRAPSGPVMQGEARFFAIPSKHTSVAWTIQCAVFVACYERMGMISARPVQLGWRLLAAFNAYLSLTETLYESDAIERLDINQAYALLTHCGFTTQRSEAALQRRECPVCLISYLVVTTEPLATQRCPVCTLNATTLRLVRQGLAFGGVHARSKQR